MMTSNDAVVAYATDCRVLAVIIGCSTALAIQIMTERLVRRRYMEETNGADEA